VLIACCLALVLLHPALFSDKSEETPEYQLKGTFIERIVRFIQWPEDSPVNNKSRPFIIGIIGENPFLVKQKGEDAPKDWLELIYIEQGIKIKSKPTEVRYISDIDGIRECNLLFVSKSEKKMLPEIVAAARENHVLTFSDVDGFAKKGIHINLILKSGNVKYEVNQTGIVEAGLTIKYQLLKYAAKIEDPQKKRR